MVSAVVFVARKIPPGRKDRSVPDAASASARVQKMRARAEEARQRKAAMRGSFSEARTRADQILRLMQGARRTVERMNRLQQPRPSATA